MMRIGRGGNERREAIYAGAPGSWASHMVQCGGLSRCAGVFVFVFALLVIALFVPLFVDGSNRDPNSPVILIAAPTVD